MFQQRDSLPPPRISRLTAACLMLLLSSGASTIANAGSYQVTYSGGTATSTQNYSDAPTDTRTVSYQLDSDGYWSGAGAVSWGSTLQDENGVSKTESSGSTTCTGNVTATFTWQVDAGESLVTDPPPTDAVIMQECNTSVGAPPSSANSGSSDNGLGFPFVPSRRGNSLNGSSKGVFYKIQEDPGNSFTITCSPSANGSGGGGVGGVGISVKYKATASPLEIRLDTGKGPQNDKRFLIGQIVDGTMTTGGLDASGWNWTVSGGEPFKSWLAVYTDENSPTSTTFTPLGSETQSEVTFSFKRPLTDNGQAIVSSPVHLAVPVGALPAGGLNANLTRGCYVDYPTLTINTYIGSVQKYSEYVQSSPNSTPKELTGMAFTGAIVDIFPESSGIMWRARVTTPAGYGPGDAGIGGWNVTQLATPNRIRRYSNVIQKIQGNGVSALDFTFGYAPVFPQLYPADGSLRGNGDEPSETWGAGMSSLTVADNFADYVMYQPPAGQFVPLKLFNWHWGAHAEPDESGVWQISDPDSGTTMGAEYPPFPMWSSNAKAGYHWVDQ